VAIVAIHKDKTAPKLYGGADAFWKYKGQEAILSGPYETGKTYAAILKLHAVLVKYPGSRAFITRQTYKSLLSTAIVTYENKVLPIHPDSPDSPIRKYGKSKPEFYDYPNGSNLLVVGMDNPDKILSGEFDYGYVNQAEEISLDAWEKLVGRCTGRAGNAPYTQVMGDCNPSHPQHWILHRAPLQRFEQLHKHNPSLYDPKTGEPTAQGRKTLAILQSLTGIRKKRGYEGLWVATEGVVYEYDSAVHKIARSRVPEIVSWYCSVDFGYTNAFVFQLWGLDRDGRLYLWHEIYMTKRTVNAHVPKIKAMIEGKKITAIVADHDAEDRATLHEHGLHTIAAKKDISVGIQAVEERLKVQGDGKPRLYVVEDACTEYDPDLYREYPGDLHPCCTEHEFPVYAWNESKDGKANKEAPIDLNNHGMDATRYMVMYLEKTSDAEYYEVPNIFGRD
jgi:PBSX family phage terminase large subunit